MVNVKKITEDLTWVGANDRRLAMFEGVYSVPRGVSYNSYLLLDDTTVLFDTVDKAVSHRFFENVAQVLGNRPLDYVVVQHMEPDHSATLQDLLIRHPETTVVCSKKAKDMLFRFFPDFDGEDRIWAVSEGDSLFTGHHKLSFVMAPMVHWPEVMVTYDETDGILFSADAFGCFGALNGAMYADEVDFDRDYMDEARRYYTNIVGKYGPQVVALLKKASALDIRMICPLHGFVWRSNLAHFIEKYLLWAQYLPEEQGVMIAYASIYGNTENAAEVLSSKLWDRGIKTVMFDTSVTPASDIIAASFRFSHLVFAAPTYNAGIFVTMEALLHDLAAHNLQNRKIGLIENGSWAPTSGGLMRKVLEPLKNTVFLGDVVTVRSATLNNPGSLDALADAIEASLSEEKPAVGEAPSVVDPKAFFNIPYGLFVLSGRDGSKDGGCIVNTVEQVTDNPKQISVAVNKANYTCTLLQKTKEFAVSVLTESAPMELFRRFGFQSGKDVNKFENLPSVRCNNGILVPKDHVNAVFCAKVVSVQDLGTHLLFIGEVCEATVVSSEKSVTYSYYFENIKPKPVAAEEKKTGYVCKMCGYVYEGEVLPEDFVCPLCKHGTADFEPIQK